MSSSLCLCKAADARLTAQFVVCGAIELISDTFENRDPCHANVFDKAVTLVDLLLQDIGLRIPYDFESVFQNQIS